MRTQSLGAGLLAPSPSSLAPFALHRPGTVAEAVDVLAEHPDTLIAAGCTDLVARFREGTSPQRVLSVRRLAELQQVSYTDGVLRLGAGLTHRRGCTNAVVAEAIPGLTAAWARIATVRIRASATLGGNLLARRNRYELSLMFGALHAQLEFADGERRRIDWLWDTDYETPGLLVAVAADTAGLRWFGYDRSMRPLTTVALALHDADGEESVALTAVVGSEYHPPVRLTAVAAGSDLVDPVVAATVAETMAAGLPDAVGDVAGSADYRRHVIGVLVRRLLGRAMEGADS